MKKLILIIGLLICFKANAQVSALGKTEEQIIHYNDDVGSKFESKNILKNFDFIILYKNTDSTSSAYQLRNDTCIRYTMIYDLIGLSKFISTLNNYTKTNDNEWIDKTYTYRLILSTDELFFYARFEKL